MFPRQIKTQANLVQAVVVQSSLSLKEDTQHRRISRKTRISGKPPARQRLGITRFWPSEVNNRNEVRVSMAFWKSLQPRWGLPTEGSTSIPASENRYVTPSVLLSSRKNLLVVTAAPTKIIKTGKEQIPSTGPDFSSKWYQPAPSVGFSQ